jgi:glutamate decarboxylase
MVIMGDDKERPISFSGHGMLNEKDIPKRPPARRKHKASNMIDSTFATRFMTEPIPEKTLPDTGVPANVAFQIIKDLRSLDTRPNLNLASFVTTWMEPEVRQLIQESLDVNFVNAEEYPSCNELSNRCIAMLASLFHSPSSSTDAVGAACVGSSEAIMLCGLAMKKRAPQKQKPNLVMGTETHVCWEKFCRYWDVEPRYVPAEDGRLIATPGKLRDLCDENTIGVIAVFGSTYTGEFEDVEGIDAMVSDLNDKNKWDIVVHVDAASGGFVAPFVYPDLKFDFRLKNVISINVSGHKYGLVYPGIGWAIWRDSKALPESMIFYADYLGSLERTITLNFSRGASHIIAQYYQFLRLGVEGYKKIMNNLMNIAEYTTARLKKTGYFDILSTRQGIPLVAFKLKKTAAYTESDLADRVRMTGFVIPAYSMPKGQENKKMMRITIREDFSMTLAEEVIDALTEATDWLEKHYAKPKLEYRSP